MNNKLQDVLNNLINDDKDAASAALSQYLHDKTARLINPQPVEAPIPPAPPKDE